MFDPESPSLEIIENAEGGMLESFADKYLADALRIVQTKAFITGDKELAYEAVCVVTAIYMNKVRNGEIERNRIIH